MQSWPHSPSKIVTDPGTYIITAATYHKEPLFQGRIKLELLYNCLLSVVAEYEWDPLAWAVFPNHYHFVGISPKVDSPVRKLTTKLHAVSARELNKLDDAAGRQVWQNCWDTRLTFEKSIMARIAYVHGNAVKHGICRSPEEYLYCSANWFLNCGDIPFVQSVLSFKTDRVNVVDDF